MEIIIYLLIFIMGTFFGSFFTLAVYRIPLGQDILYTHSYCPNCKHKLNIFDLFPVFSYIFLKGKCRYCGNKIRIRYLILEVLSGITFLLYALSFKIDFMYLEIYKLINFAFGILYFVSLFIIAGIDKENKNIQNSLLVYSFAISFGYIIYVCTQNINNVYSYGIYLFAMLIFVIINSILVHKYKKQNYIVQLIALSIYMMIFSKAIGFIITLVLSCIIMLIICIMQKILKSKIGKISIAFYLCIINILFNIFTNFLQYYIL